MLPHSTVDRRAVRPACSNLMGVTQKLITSRLNGRRRGGVLTYQGFALAYGAVLTDSLLTLEGEPRHRGISSVGVPARIATRLNAPGLMTAVACFANPWTSPVIGRAN